jgi:hypothetical protein
MLERQRWREASGSGQRVSAAEVLGIALVVLASGGAITARGRR